MSASQRVFTRAAIVRGLGLYALLGGLVSLAGWAADLPRLTDWFASGISIQPNTALATMLAAAAVLLLRRTKWRASALLGALVTALGASTLFQYAAGVELERLNTLLMFGREWGRVAVTTPGRMGPPGAVSWTLVGVALVLLASSALPRARRAVPLLALFTLSLATFSVVGYVYRADPLYSLPYLTGIALQTATFLVALSAALIGLVPEQAPMRWLRDRGATGAVARRILPFIVCVPPLIGWLALHGELAGFYDSRFEIAIMVFSWIALLAGLLAWNLVTIARHDAELRRSERRLINTLERRQADYEAITRLQALSTHLVHSGELNPLLQEIVAASADVTATYKASIQLHDPQTGRLRTAVHQGLGPLFLANFAEDGWDRGCGAAASSGERVVMEDVTQVAEGDLGREVLLAEGIRSFQSTPLLSRDGRLLGMLNTHFAEPHRPGERELRYLDLLARMAADFIERSQSEQALREADRRKDEFLAMLSHELRNPLAPIRNAVEVLRLAGDDREAVRSASELMDRQLRQMIRLVDDLLDVSRITRGKIELRSATVELGSVVQQAVESTRWLVDAMDHKLEVLLPARALHVRADAARLIQVLGNLLHNACKFSEPGGRIRLAVEQQDGHALIGVRDSGIGIAADALPRIFELFTQVDTSLDRKAGGLGIGLTLVKRLVELHGGSVEARSEGLGRGSEFVVRLALADAPAVPGERARGRAHAAAPRRRILIVDDNRDSAESLAMMLAMSGNETQTAHDGLAAIEVASEFRPDLVLLDIGLPQLTGYEVCRRIREQAWGRHMHLVAVTGWGQDDDRERSKQAGFDAHFVKPVDPDALASLIASLG